MSLLSDVPKVLHVSHSLASSSEGTPLQGGEGTEVDESAVKPSHGVLHLAYAHAHNGRADELPLPKNVSLVLSRGQVESLTAQLYRMLDRVGGGGGGVGGGQVE
jgi:hypothetical protein